jgi:hypothetical protein
MNWKYGKQIYIYVCSKLGEKKLLFEIFKVCISLVLLTQDSLEEIMLDVVNHFIIVHN